MAQYVDKDALIAEIEKVINEINLDIIEDWRRRLQRKRDIKVMKNILSLINTLEIKEVDLEKELQDHIRECLDIKFPTTDIELIKKDVEYTARKFFELGLKTQRHVKE